MIKKLPFLAFMLFTVSAIAQQQAPFLQWEKLYGGTKSDQASSVQQTTDGGYVLAGSEASNSGILSGNHGSYDIWIVKLNADGNLQWQKALGSSGRDVASNIIQTTDGGYIVAGTTDSNDGDVSGNHGNEDAWLMKLDTAGNIQWQKTYGSTGYDAANSVQQTTDGGYVFAGHSGANDGDVTGNHGNTDYWVVKINAGGSIQWQKSYGGSNGDDAKSIKQTSDGGYVLAGITASNDGQVTRFQGVYDYWIVKINSSGNLQWQKSYGGTNFDFATDIQQTKGGGYIITGNTASSDGDVTGYHTGVGCSCYVDYWVVKLYPDGNLNWEKSLGNFYDDAASQILQTDDGNFVVAGWGYYSGGDISHTHGLTDFWIVNLNNQGKINWEKTYGQTRFDQANSIALTNDKGFIVAGWSGDSEGGKGIDNKNRGGSDYAIMKLSPDVLSDNITITNIQTTVNCSGSNSLSCLINNPNSNVVRLYRYGTLYDSSINHTGTIIFNKLISGTYYVTETSNDVTSTSSSVDVLPVPVSTGTTNITSTSARLNWNNLECADDYTIKYKVWGAAEWTQKKTSGNVNTYNLFDLTPSTAYVVKVALNKSNNYVNGTSKFSDSIVFTTADAFIADDLKAKHIGSTQLIVSPNPAKNSFKIVLNSTLNNKVNATLYDVNGKAVWSSGLINSNALNGKYVNATPFAKGVFYLKITNEKGELIGGTKIIIAK